MNRFQLEVAEMDRRHALLVRFTTFFGSAILILLALWAAGFPPASWRQATQRWWPNTHGSPIADAAPSEQDMAEPSTNTAATAARAPDPLIGTDSSVAPTPQPLFLVSTAPGRSKNEGTARLGTSRANPQTYVAGALLANGARIAEIYSDHVVLQRGQQQFELFVAGAKKAGERTNAARELAMVGAPPVDEKPPVLAEDRLSETVRTMAHYEHDVLAGLQVIPGKRSGTFTQLGLHSGDVIVAIDGIAVTDAQAATDMLRTLLDGAAISVRVRRDGLLTDIALDGSIMAEVK